MVQQSWTAADRQVGVLARSGDFSGAEQFFTRAATAAHGSGSRLEEAREQLNALRTRLDRQELDPIRNDVLRRPRQAFRTLIEPVYLDSADIKLQRAGRLTTGSEEQQHLLRQVRDRLESLKQAEVQDYFERACITSKSLADTTTPQLHGAAIICPIILPDRLEVLIDVAGNLRRFVTPIGRGEVTAAIRRARLSLSKSVQGFPELPRVVDELHSVAAEYPAQPLQDESFRIASVEAGLAAPDFTAVHLATHGEFSADHRQSFVLTYDNRLTLDNLQDALGRRFDNPLDLLVLGACRTAAFDEASALLMTDFYRRLKAGNAGKAESLREAQRALLRQPKYQHPGYWAPYLLIGNWT